ncbi:hypothetical protein K438DRAFT_1819722 [Mycena galopus ATCC 62051]|nr:hypothetical protein K438DRAFT_1819722 [Mycena galopus ATCC 62051]
MAGRPFWSKICQHMQLLCLFLIWMHRCTQCGSELTDVRVSQGHNSPTTKGLSYQKCIRNHFIRGDHPDTFHCTGFYWRYDIPRQQPHSMSSPSPFNFPPTSPDSFLPTPPDSFSSTSHNSFGSPISPSTPSPSRPTGRARAAKQPCTGTACTQSGQRGGHRHAQCLKLLCKACCQRTLQYCPAPKHNEPIASAMNSVTLTPRHSGTAQNGDMAPASSAGSTRNIPLIYSEPKGRMVDISYVHKFGEGNHELASSDRFQREIYRKSNVNAVNVLLWLEDGQESVPLTIQVPTFPWFHPKDSELIVSLASGRNGAPTTGHPCSSFGYWAKNQNTWVVTDTAMEIHDVKSPVLLRLAHVTNCIGDPVTRLMDTKSPSSTLKVSLWLENGQEGIDLAIPVTSRSFHPKESELITSLAAPLSCTSFGFWAPDHRWVLTDGAIEILDPSLPIYLRLIHVTDCMGGPTPPVSRTQSKRRLSVADTPSPTRVRGNDDIRPDISPLKFGIPMPRTSTVISLLSDEEDDQDGGEDELELEPSASRKSIPPPSSQPRFPLRYVVDMDDGFQAMDEISGMVLPAKFFSAFRTGFVSSTYHKHRNVWDGIDPQVLATAIKCGRSTGGEWVHLVTQYYKAGKSSVNKS